MPLPLTLEGLVAAAILLWMPKRQKVGKWLLTTTVIFFLAVTNTWFSSFIIKPFDTYYKPLPDFARSEDLPPNIRERGLIVVLGYGNGNAEGQAS